MKCIVGIDLGGSYKPALSLLAKLQFKDLHAQLIHVVEPMSTVIPYAGLVPAIDSSELWTKMRDAGVLEVNEAVRIAGQLGIDANIEVLDGFAGQSITERGDGEHVELICIGASHGGIATTIFGGSVAKVLVANGKQSLLVAKRESATDGTLTVAFATDHSEYCNRSLERLVALEPQGIGKIHVITAYELRGHPSLRVGRESGMEEADIEGLLEQSVLAKTEEVASKLRSRGFVCEAHTLKGDPNRAIHQSMEALEADLLIIGAQGHGIWNDLLMGSIALHQVSAEPYSVLVLRN